MMKKDQITFPFTFFSFIVSLLFFLICSLLYAWGAPPWLENFPYASGLRFLLALGIYLLSCSAYLLMKSAELFMGRSYSFPKSFSLAFLPVVIFSGLVLFGSSLQLLRGFYFASDAILWIIASLIFYRLDTKQKNLVRYEMSIRLWKVFFVVFAVAALFSLFSIMPTAVVLFFRIILLLCAVFASLMLNGPRYRQKEGTEEFAKDYALSPRETEITALLLQGKTNAEICQSLFISLATVKTHIASIFRKTGARNRTELSALFRNG
ncbi:helix-turn-helix transcriptional regulator [Sediminispirochaeta smaragdinae]|uniref:Transcriptional regulator, LuxR family n=1 Tax=Sediminispirochaeta smaragdinae (strain DSM 11293 / JCM 15392 / SEBR 4228) TaxID=573413 RepID=E1R2V8_SEDSS|nr:helix-turn-helix transcriptional regulator [Sediminispirochaeta smaragdinae]ADK80390.1 transcriptional regulator, LuxR family [Sediminispirochaeta smaragdinae DSM 11293]